MRDAIVEAMARGIDPDVWAEILPIPTRQDVVSFHARRQASMAMARKALSALEAMGATVGVWQDIASAPRDGTEIICWPAIRREVDGVIPSAVGAWLNTKGGPCWVDMSVGHHNGFWKPTHWLPLPAAPLAASPMQQGEG